MAKLFSLLPRVDELPYYNTKVEAIMKLLKSVKHEPQAQPQNGYKKNMQRIADEPIAQKLTMLKPSFEKQFNNYSSRKSHFVIGSSFSVIGIHPECTTTFGTNISTSSLGKTPQISTLSHKLDKQKIPPKPNMLVEDQHLDRVRNEFFQWRNQSLLLRESQLMETKEEASARTHAHLNRQMHRV